MKNKRRNITFFIIILSFLLFYFIYLEVNNDGMQNINEVKVYYKTYSKEKRWSKWIKNSKTSGNKKDSIKNISIKIKNKTKYTGDIVYRLYTEDGKWTDELSGESSLKNKKINGIKIGLNNELKSYNVCYRTYNTKEKWTNWTCNGLESGNKKYNMKAIEIKIIPRGALYKDYLREYESNNFTTIDDFGGNK